MNFCVRNFRGFTFRVVQLQVAYFYSTLFSIKLYQYFYAQINISVLGQCSYSALTVLIQFGRFISLFRVLVHAKTSAFERLSHPFTKKSSAIRTAEPYSFTKNLHPFDSRSRYPAVSLCLSLQTGYPLRSSFCPLSKRHKQINPTVRINSLNIRSLLYRLKREL